MSRSTTACSKGTGSSRRDAAYKRFLAEAPSAAGFPLALVLAAARSLLSGQTIGGRGLGRVCGVPLAQGELSFQVGDLLFLFGDLLFLFRDLLFLLGDLLLGVG